MSSRGRHRKPSKTAKIIAPGVTAGAIVALTAGAAQAQALPSGDGNSLRDMVQTSAKVSQYAPKHDSGEIIVQSGDTLSGLAGKHCGNPRDWTGWWNYNHKSQHWSSPDVIKVGDHVFPDCRDEQVWLKQPKPVYRTVSYSAPVRSSGYQAHGSYSGYSGNVSAASYGGYQSCVITRESGGNSQVMNSSGHYGLYQFDYGTWVSGGGAGGDFGHASVQEQNRVFANVYAARGTQPWTPSDGC